MDLPDGTWLLSNRGEPDNDSGLLIPCAVIHLPGVDDTELREELWSQYKDVISGRMVHCFGNELEMEHFWNDTGVEP